MTVQNNSLSVEEIPLAAAAAEAGKAYGTLPPSGAYRRLQGLAQDGRIGVIRRGNRIFVLRSDLPDVARALGMTPASVPVAA